MAGASMLDVRLPIGALFTALGLLLGGYGLSTAGNPAHYTRSLSININLWWGLVMLLFGVILLLSARGSRRVGGAIDSAEGRAVEEREHRRGLEREGR